MTDGQWIIKDREFVKDLSQNLKRIKRAAETINEKAESKREAQEMERSCQTTPCFLHNIYSSVRTFFKKVMKSEKERI